MGRRNNKRFNNSQRKFRPKFNTADRQFNNRNPETEFANKGEEFVSKESLKEDQAGITEYVNGGEGFKGILKSRFSDFHVNEIDTTGQVLTLNDLSVPEEQEKLTFGEAEQGKMDLKDVISEDIWDQMDQLMKTKQNYGKDFAIHVEVTTLDKEQRTKFHKVIKRLYERKLASSTVKNDKDQNKKFVRILKTKGRGNRKEWTFPQIVVHFLVHKENMDTCEVASTIANKLNLKASQVNYAGTKDKRAKTTQKFSIKRRTPREIVGSVKHLNGVTIGNFKFKSHILKLGDLHGNRFRIAIRNLTGDKTHIETSLNNVKEQGFVNYFGLQRFGNCPSIPTYEIGAALLKYDYKLACELILKPRDNDVPFLKRVREMWWKNRDSRAAAVEIRSERFIEKKLLDGLAQYGESDYANALGKIPRNMLLLYPHAFQSLIFNKVASKRIKEFGLSLLPGDLVYRNRLAEAMQNTESSEHQEDNEEKDEDIDEDLENVNDNNDEEIENVTDNYGKESENTSDNNDNEAETATHKNENEEENSTDTNKKETKKAERISRFKKKVKSLTEEDIDSGDYTIYDIVLSLPGYDIVYPNNIVGTWYNEFMKEYDLTSEKLNHKMFSMRGAYRKLVVRPKDMSWEFKSYSTPEETLILSDLEILQGKTLDDFKNSGIEPKYEALLLDFSLPSAAYATMMLRELLKCDTSSAAQSILQQAAIKEHTAMNAIEKEKNKSFEAVGEQRNSGDIDIDEETVEPLKILKDEPTDEKEKNKSFEAVGEKRKADDAEIDEETVKPTKILKDEPTDRHNNEYF